jgi:hypothetical protein
MGCTTDKPNSSELSVIWIEGQWKGTIGLGHAPNFGSMKKNKT